MNMIAAMLLLCPVQEVKDGFLEDPQFPVVFVPFTSTADWSRVTSDGRVLITLLPNLPDPWVIEWDLETGVQRGFVHHKQIFKHRQMVALSPTAAHFWRWAGSDASEKEKIPSEYLDLKSGKVKGKLDYKPDQKILSEEQRWWVRFRGDVLIAGKAAKMEKGGFVWNRLAGPNVSSDFRYAGGYTQTTSPLRGILVDLEKQVKVLESYHPVFLFTPDSKFVATLDSRDRATLHRLPDGKETARWDVPEGSALAGLSPDGSRVWYAHSERLILWDVKENKELTRIAGEGPLFSADGKRLVTAGRMQAIDVMDGKARMIAPALRGSQPSPRFSPDGRLMLLYDNWDQGLTVWSLAERRFLWERKWKVGILDASFSADGKRLVLAPPKEDILVLNGDTGEELARVKNPAADGKDPAFLRVGGLPDPDTIFVAYGGKASRIRLSDGAALWTISGNGEVRLSGDRKTAVWVTKMAFVDLESGAVQELGIESREAALTPDGSKVAALTEQDRSLKVRILDRQGKLLHEFVRKGHPLPAPRRVWFSADGRHLLISVDGKGLGVAVYSVEKAAFVAQSRFLQGISGGEGDVMMLNDPLPLVLQWKPSSK